MSKYRNSGTFDDRYPARRLLDLIGDKWTPIVLYCLSGGVRRFNEMQPADTRHLKEGPDSGSSLLGE
jgi:DNA-binding HxlR family transcriptional regulator